MFPFPDRSVVVIPAAVLLDWLLGDPRWLPHPVVQIGRLIAWLERLLRRCRLDGLLGGALLLLITVGITAAVTGGVLYGARLVHPWLGDAVAVLFSWTCLAARSLHRESRLVADALRRGDLPVARRYLSFIVGRDTAELDAGECWRGAVETVAENASDGVIAPLLFLMLGGPVAGLAYKAVNTLDSMVGYRNDRYLLFGRASARFDDLLNLIPARLTGLLMVLVAPFVGLSCRGAWRVMRRDGRNHSSPNSGISEAAAAGALGVRLGGTNRYFGKPAEKPTIGDPLQPLGRNAWSGAVRLMYGAEIALLVALMIVRVLQNL